MCNMETLLKNIADAKYSVEKGLESLREVESKMETLEYAVVTIGKEIRKINAEEDMLLNNLEKLGDERTRKSIKLKIDTERLESLIRDFVG